MKTIAKTLNKARFAILAVLTIGILGFLLTTRPSHADEQANSSDYNNRINPDPDACGVSLTVPKFLCVNDDDDQLPTDEEYYEKWDWKHNPSPMDDDLREVTITGTAGKGGGTMTLSIQEGGDKIGGKFWKDGEKMEEQTELSWDVEPNSSRTVTVYIEGQKHSDKKEDVVLKAVMVCFPTSDTTGGRDEVVEKTTVYQVDTDVDSNNNEGFTFSERSEEEDQMEFSEKYILPHGKRPGKYVCTNNINDDGVVDWADGYDLASNDDKDDEVDGLRFIPMIVELKEPFDPEKATIKFKYKAGDPKDVLITTVTINDCEFNTHALPSGDAKLRIWKKEGSPSRNKESVSAGGDYVPDDEFIEWKKICPEGRVVTLYVESLKHSDSRGDVEVVTIIKEEDVKCEDSIKMTTIEVTPNVSEVYAFRGHVDDDFECKFFGPVGTSVKWRWETNNQFAATIINSTSTTCTIHPRYSNWEDMLQLEVDDGIMVCEKSVEILVIKPRSDWSPQPIDLARFDGGIPSLDALTMHHSAGSDDGAAAIRAIQEDHIDQNFGDIGYHFIMTKDGTLWEGRTLERTPALAGGKYTKGAHTGGANTAAGLGICMLGSYEPFSATDPATWDSEDFPDSRKRKFIQNAIAAMARYKIDKDTLKYHGKILIEQGSSNSSACPGQNVKDEYCDMFRIIRSQLEDR